MQDIFLQITLQQQLVLILINLLTNSDLIIYTKPEKSSEGWQEVLQEDLPAFIGISKTWWKKKAFFRIDCAQEKDC